MTLEINNVTLLLFVFCSEEMVESHLEKRSHRSIRGNMSPYTAFFPVSPHHHGHRIPANDIVYSAFDFPLTRIRGLLVRGYCINVWSSPRRADFGSIFLGLLMQQAE